MTAEFLRDAATAAVFGFFASAWFGWAQAILVTLASPAPGVLDTLEHMFEH
jgi:hypothetical protein